ncbi:MULTISPECIES: hypothetical protein [Chryseobacterium]|jgi:hypothetical protein|uniref:Uncharacterized protein n=1 Tax=Chryseobacterium nepalense TaxID=1854498 RepID=A0ABY4K8U4_9FLAO|nr:MULTISPECIES: hypothetical protein [Chryseobacterium]MEA1848717.1 hypothetical protein [Chryseobacterium sp. MHB01]UPQ76193.1 hypothetical protein M0D58_01295 [Chryseobacterium nepalense]
MSIKIQVAKCTDCNGYYSSAPLENKDIFNPEITDHYFYHGEPWFTLDLNAFEKFKKYERTEIKVVELDEHRKQDHLHCHCPKKKTVSKKKYAYSASKKQHTLPAIEKYDADTDIYFKDLYYTYNNFHGINAGNYSNSNRKFR